MNKFKVGELVEQIRDVWDESPLCKILYISYNKKTGITTVEHRHINSLAHNFAPIKSFRKIPKLKRILLFGK